MSTRYEGDEARQSKALIFEKLLSTDSLEVVQYQKQQYSLSIKTLLNYKHLIINFLCVKLGYFIENMFSELRKISTIMELISKLGIYVVMIVGILFWAAHQNISYVFHSQTEQGRFKIGENYAFINKINDEFRTYQQTLSFVEDDEDRRYKKYLQYDSNLKRIIRLQNDSASAHRPINFNIALMKLHYKYSQFVNSYRNQKNRKQFLKIIDEQQAEHDKLKSKLMQQIKDKTKYRSHNTIVELYDYSGKLAHRCDDPNRYLSNEDFLHKTYRAIFQSETKIPIQKIFSRKYWRKFNKKSSSPMQKTKATQYFAYLGLKQQQYLSILTNGTDSSIRDITFNQSLQRWASYSEHLISKRGSYDWHYQFTGKKIQFKKYKVITLEERMDTIKIIGVTLGNQVQNIIEFPKKGENLSKETVYCLELDENYDIRSIETDDSFNMKFTFQIKQNRRKKITFTGQIQSLSKSHSVFYKSTGFFQSCKSFILQKLKMSNQSEDLKFESVIPVSYFTPQNTNERQQLNQFICTIVCKSQSKKKYMVRKDRLRTDGSLGFEAARREQFRIKLLERAGRNQYKGTISIITEKMQMPVYCSQSKGLKWTSQTIHNQENIFFMTIYQD